MLRNFRFDNRSYKANKVKKAAPKMDDNSLQDSFEEEDTQVDILEEDLYEHAETIIEDIDLTEENSDDEAFWSDEKFSSLPTKLPGPLGVIDEDIILLIVLFILLQSPKKDLSLIIILLLLFINK